MIWGMATRTAGPDYWFVDPAYAEIDRLTDDECPMDVIDKSWEWDMLDREAAELHYPHCPYYGRMGIHLPEQCIAGGV